MEEAQLLFITPHAFAISGTDLCDVFILLACRGRLNIPETLSLAKNNSGQHKTSFLFRSIARKKLFAELQRGASQKRMPNPSSLR